MKPKLVLQRKKSPWRRYECVGGPFDGTVVQVWRQVHNIILIDRHGRASEYLNEAVPKLSVLLAAPYIVGEPGTASDKIEYSGWLTKEELRYAKQLAKQ